VLIIRNNLFQGDENERNALDHRIYWNLSAAADLCAAQNGHFHLNAGCLSGDRQKKYHHGTKICFTGKSAVFNV
jgi:hypothetical protein